MNIRINHAFIMATLVMGLGTMPMQAAQQGMSLHEAAELGDLAWVRELLSTEAGREQLEQIGTWGTPLYCAVQSDREEVVRLLLKHGADSEYRCTTTGTTALFLAVNINNVTLAQILLEGGADTNASTPLTKTVPLHWAVDRRNRDIALLLARYGANIDAKNRYGKSPLSEADPRLQAVLTQGDQERLKAIRVWAGHLQEHGLLSDIVRSFAL